MVRALLVVALLAGCGGSATTPTPAPTPESYTVDGVFTLRDPGGIYLNRSSTGIHHCTGEGGYADIKPGLQVVIRDGDGSTLGTGQLAYDHEAHKADENRCPLVFDVSVPRADFYAIEVGDRGELTYSFADMQAQGWAVELTLGG